MVLPRILLVDDDTELTASVSDYLRIENFVATAAGDASSALQLLAQQTFDIAVIDVMMPGESGLDLLRDIRRTSDLPVLMLTARVEDLDRILGLELGADDYLGKPFHLRELSARIRAILRRFHRSEDLPHLKLGKLLLDRSRLLVELDGAPVKLTSAEFMVLEALMRDPGTLMDRASLTTQALGRELEPYDRSIDTHISNLRRKLYLQPGGPLEIRSIRGKGYILMADREPR